MEETAAVAQALKSRLRYVGRDGREYTYLGDNDSYAWLRAARNYLRTGTTCDAVLEGECRDTFTNGPIGTRMIYNRSMHIVAIVVLHKFLTLFNPDYPLAASSYLVPVIVSLLGLFPAFFIGRRLAGSAGGLVAAILIEVEPTFLMRSYGSDNDVWNVVLPLFIMWLAMLAMGSRRRLVRVGYALLAAAVVGLHAITWRGWMFSYAVVMAGLLGHALLCVGKHVVRERNSRVWQDQAVRASVLVLVVFYVASGPFTLPAGSPQSYLTIPLEVLGLAPGSPVANHLSNPSDAGLWPDMLLTVGELSPTSHTTIVRAMGGRIFYAVGLLGLLLLLLPKGRWRLRHAAVLIGGASLYSYPLFWGALSKSLLLVVLALPLLGALLSSVVDAEESGATHWSDELLTAVWFLAALYLAFGGVRFLLLIGPAFGMVAAVAAGRLYGWLGVLAQRTPQRFRPATKALLAAMLIAGLIAPIHRGYSVGQAFTPRLTDAWWNTLSKLRRSSTPDAIVTSWWDYGYWIKYGANRRVIADGATLLKRVHHWIGQLLVAADEQESIGIMRMLACGSDSAYRKIIGSGHDPIAAFEMVAALVKLDKAAAQIYLAQRRFSPAEQAVILRLVHCAPPEVYLIITSELLTTVSSWVQMGRWDIRRASVAKIGKGSPRSEAVAAFVKRFGYSRREATALYEQLRQLKTKRDIENFVTPRIWRLSHDWHRCRINLPRKEWTCPVNITDRTAKRILDSFMYRPESPRESRLRIRSLAGKRRATNGVPAAIVLAGKQRKHEIAPSAPTVSDLAVLVDIPNHRILVGSPYMIRSTFTHLMFLDGRYAKYYEKFDDRTTYTGVRIVTWKVNWGK